MSSILLGSNSQTVDQLSRVNGQPGSRLTAAVIGSGFGGLAAAIRLQSMGIKTVCFEGRDKPGGRAYVFEDAGFTFDAGPTVITAPHCIEELFALTDRDMKDYVELLPVADVKHKYNLPGRLCHDLLDGMEMDANKIRILSEQDLLLYCYRAAGSVGLLMSRLIGARDARAYSHAKSLGIAMQLTNIARDVGEDWRMGRCYIPSEWLCGSNRQVDRLTVKRHVRNLLRLADQHYRVGVQGLVYLPWHARFAIRSAAMLYQAIGAEISRNDDDTISKRAVVPWYRKLGVVFKSLCAELRFCTLQISQNLASKVFGFPQLPGELVMNCEARYLVSLGLSLTLIMATALFLMVGVNPKDSSYQSLPWIYAAMSAMSAVVFGSMAKRFQHQLEVRVQPKPAAVREKTSQNLY